MEENKAYLNKTLSSLLPISVSLSGVSDLLLNLAPIQRKLKVNEAPDS